MRQTCGGFSLWFYPRFLPRFPASAFFIDIEEIYLYYISIKDEYLSCGFRCREERKTADYAGYARILEIS
jgi:hypothetical protein